MDPEKLKNILTDMEYELENTQRIVTKLTAPRVVNKTDQCPRCGKNMFDFHLQNWHDINRCKVKTQ